MKAIPIYHTLAWAIFSLFSMPASASLIVIGETVHSMAGNTWHNAAVVIRNGKIMRMIEADRITPTNNDTVLRARVVTPGFVDAHTTVGFSGMLNQDHDQEQVEKSSPIQPELRAIDAYNARDELVDWVRRLGVTTIHTGHGPGALISGQTMVIKTDRKNISDGVMVPIATVAGTLGNAGLAGDSKSPGTRAKAAALLRQELIKAQAYQTKLKQSPGEKIPDRDLRLEILTKVLSKEVPLLVTAHRQQDILTAIRIADEFNIPIILDGAAEAHLILDGIKSANLPVILHPTMIRPFGDAENATLEAAKLFKQAGIPFALQSGYEAYVPKTRVVSFEAAMTLAYGLSFEDALASITLNAAKILKIDDRVGSIEPGKDADLALFDGDPFEYTTRCIGVVIEGRVYPGEESH